MDIFTWAGLLAGIGIILAAIAAGSGLGDFLNLPGLAIVVLGTFAVTLMKFRWPSFRASMGLAFRVAFTDKAFPPSQLYTQLRELGDIVRKQGLLGLDGQKIEYGFLQRAIDLCADGYDTEFVEEILLEDTQQELERLQVAEQVFRGIGEAAPALGMLGTLVGLVQMLSNMGDPSSLGPAMAVALLTTFYGAFIAQLIAIPLADKLQFKAIEEARCRAMVIQSMLSMLRGQNPRTLKDILVSYLPELTEGGQAVAPAGGRAG